MKPLKQIAAFAVVLLLAFSFANKHESSLKIPLNLSNINIENVLKHQQFDCRPSSEFVFEVETNITKRIRGANNINAKIFIIERATGKKNLLAQENLQVKNFEDAIALDNFNSNIKTSKLFNGDSVIGGSENAPYAFNELIKYDAIYNSYINSTNKLLRLKRTI